MIVSILEGEAGAWDGWSVWVALEEGDPTTQTESICIGVGKTVEEAAALAIKTLHQALDVVVVQAYAHGVRVEREP